MKTIAFSGSNSSNSINQKLAKYAASLLPNTEVINLNAYNIPMYSIDIEDCKGIPEAVKDLETKLSTADNFIISVSEHNGNISAFFKNNLDWLSRHNRHFLADKKIIILSTSPGKSGGNSALQITEKTLPYFGANVVKTMSFGSFYDFFKADKIEDEDINKRLKDILIKI
jgi:NAD(P)H-dependent FMN reductase